jgi:hypothetical protein
MNWRPRNETAQDRVNEQRGIGAFASRFNADAVKLSETLYGVDFAITRSQKVVAWAEFKARKVKYDSLLISAAKVWKLACLARDSALPSFLVIEWPDGIWYWRVPEMAPGPVSVGGNSRGQNGDVEPVYLIPSSEFRLAKPTVAQITGAA